MKKKISKSNLSIFKNYLIPNNKNKEKNMFPNLITKNGKKNNNNYLSISSLSNNNLRNKNKIYRMQLTSNVKSLTEYNKKNSVIYTIRKSDHKMKYKAKLEKEEKEKLQNLVNYFKELDDNNPKTKYDIKYNNSLNESNYKDISNTFTKVYRITRQQQKLDVIKLNSWDEDNLESFYGNTNIIYQYLVKYYKKKLDKNKLNELEYFKRIIDTNGNFVDNILKTANANNKIIQSIKKQKNLEQGSILHNIISKTHYRFKNDLIVKDKKIALNFGIDNDALAAMKKEKDMGSVYYSKIIKDKEKQENAKRDELMNLSIKILNKKKEKSIKEKNIGKIYEETNNLIKKYNAKMIKINDEIYDKKEHFKKIKNIETEDEDNNKKNHLNQIQTDIGKLELELIRLKYELKSEIKKLEMKKQELNEDLEIFKNELLFMKIAHIYLTKEQRNYYLDLLNKGYDIRSDGLVWIVKRLLEIQTKLEYHHFPKYLDKEQADYIIELANINLEEAQLKIVIDVLQKKQILINNDMNSKMMRKILVLSKKRKTIIEENNSKNNSLNKKKTIELEPEKDNKIFNSINDIYKKYAGAFKINSVKNFDELREKQITEELKLSLLEGGTNGPHDNLDELAGLLQFLNNNKDNKNYFEFILKLKLRMRLLSKKKEILKQKQINLFRETLDNDNRFNYAESSLKYDLVWGALFGNKYIL